MKPFNELTHRGQLQRLKKLTETALSDYDLVATDISSLLYLYNATFRIETANGRYVMRVYRPNHRTPDQIRSEMAWMWSLSQDTDIVVPEPIRTKVGEFSTEAEIKGIPEPRSCALFRWVDGEYYKENIEPTRLEQVGQLMAIFHDHASTYEPPDFFDRPKVGFDGVVGHIVEELKLNARLLSTRERQVFLNAANKAQPIVEQLGTEPDVYNLIHADLHQANYLFHEGTVRAIDFDDCGYGHFLYDMAVTLWYLRRLKNYGTLRAAFLRGYASKRPLPPNHDFFIDVYLSVRSILLGLHVASETNPQVRAWAPRFIAATTQDLQDFVQKLN